MSGRASTGNGSEPVDQGPPDLRYVSDESPGIRRRRRGRGFSYVAPDGTPVADERELERIRSLAVPPAWTDVWISPDPGGHIQATGRDARGRKQYRYHPRWREHRDRAKFDRMLEFGSRLPRIRRRVERDLRRRGLPKEKVLAAVTMLLDSALMRIGNDDYARENGSYGATTLRARHVDVSGSTIRFRFRGKSGKVLEVDLRDRRLASVVRRCQELPGQELFAYVDDDGEARKVTSDDVNEYLREIAGDDVTAKDFRTWAGTVLAAIALAEAGDFERRREGERNVTAACRRVADILGNTPAVCRASYVHPALIDAYLDGSFPERIRVPGPLEEQRLPDLRAVEREILRFLAELADPVAA